MSDNNMEIKVGFKIDKSAIEQQINKLKTALAKVNKNNLELNFKIDDKKIKREVDKIQQAFNKLGKDNSLAKGFESAWESALSNVSKMADETLKNVEKLTTSLGKSVSSISKMRGKEVGEIGSGMSEGFNKVAKSLIRVGSNIKNITLLTRNQNGFTVATNRSTGSLVKMIREGKNFSSYENTIRKTTDATKYYENMVKKTTGATKDLNVENSKFDISERIDKATNSLKGYKESLYEIIKSNGNGNFRDGIQKTLDFANKHLEKRIQEAKKAGDENAYNTFKNAYNSGKKKQEQQSQQPNQEPIQQPKGIEEGVNKTKKTIKGLSGELYKLSARANRDLGKIGNAFLSIGKKGANAFNSIGASIKGMFVKLSDTLQRLGYMNMGLQAIGNVFRTTTNFLKNFFGVADNLNTTMRKTDIIFGEASQSIKSYSNAVADGYGLASSSVQEMLNYTANFVQGMGMSRDSSIDFAKAVTDLSVKLGNFANADPSEVMNDINSALVGNREGMDKYGVNITNATLNQYMLKKGIDATVESLDQEQLAILTLQYIQDASINATAMWDSGNRSLSQSASMVAQSFKQIKENIGTGLLGVVSKCMGAINALMQKLVALSELVKAVFEALGFGMSSVGSISSKVSDTVKAVGGGVGDIATGLNDIASGGAKASKAMDKLGKEAKDARKELMGIDEINVIKADPDSGSDGGAGGSDGGAGGGTSVGGINLDGLADSSKETDLVVKNVEEMAQKIKNILLTIFEPFKQAWMNMRGSILTHLEQLKQAFKRFKSSVSSLLIGIWNNGGKELIQSLAELGLAIYDVGVMVSTSLLNAFSDFFNWVNPENNSFTRTFIGAYKELVSSVKSFVYSLADAFNTFLSSGGQAFLNVIGDIISLVGTILCKVLADAIKLVEWFINSWVGTAVIATIAVTLDLIAGAIKLVLVAIEKLLPLIEALGLAFGALYLVKFANDFKTAWSVISGGNEVAKTLSKTLGGKLATSLGNVKNKFVAFKDTIKNTLTTCKDLVKVVGTKLLNALKDPVGTIKSFGTALKTCATNALTFGKNLITSAVSGIKSLISNCITGVTSLLGLTGAEAGATAGAVALKVALSAIGITLIIGLIALLVENWDKVCNVMKKVWEWCKKVGEVFSKLWDVLKDIPVIGTIFKIIEGIIKGVVETIKAVIKAVDWLWDKVKQFLGFEGGEENKPAKKMDELGDESEETGEKITTTSDKFGTACSNINTYLSSINFPTSKLAEQFEEAFSVMDEKFNLLSKNAQEYLNAIASGDTEALSQMNFDTDTCLNEIKGMYNDLSDEAKNSFYSTYGEIEGINDGWLNYTDLTWTEAVSRHVAYCQNIQNNEQLSYQEKQRLIDEDRARMEQSYTDRVEAIKQKIDEITSYQGLSEAEKKEIIEGYNEQLKTLEQEKADAMIDSIESVGDATGQVSETVKSASEEQADAQVKALEKVDKALKETKDNFKEFSKESKKTAQEIPTHWDKISEKISKEFKDLKSEITKCMTDIINVVSSGAQKVATSMNTEFSKVRTSTVTSFRDMNKEINNSMNNIGNTIKNIFNSIKTSVSNTLNSILNVVNTVTRNIQSNITNNLGRVKDTFSSSFSGIDNIVSGKLNSVNSVISSRMNTMLATMRNGISNLQNAWNSMYFATKTPYLKMPHISAYGSFDMRSNPPRVPQFYVSYYAKGGIMTNPTLFGMNGNTAMVGGEAGAEAILPLDTLWKELEKNFDKHLGNNNSKDTNLTINLTLDGDILTTKVIEGIHSIERRTGRDLLLG